MRKLLDAVISGKHPTLQAVDLTPKTIKQSNMLLLQK